MNVYPSPSRCNRDTSPPERILFSIIYGGFFVSFLLFLLSQKKKQEKPDGKRKKKKGSAVSLGVLEKRLFRIKCSDRFSSLRRALRGRTPSANPTVPDLLVSLDGGGGRSRTARREGGGRRLWVADDHWSPLHYYR